MISIIGLRGDKFMYEEEKYSYDPEEVSRIIEFYDPADNVHQTMKNTRIADGIYNLRKGCGWMFCGNGQALKELLATLNQKEL